jgi:hypothetical protein
MGHPALDFDNETSGISYQEEHKFGDYRSDTPTPMDERRTFSRYEKKQLSCPSADL